MANYKMATRMEGGRLLNIAGQVARDARGMSSGRGISGRRCARCFRIDESLAGAGGDVRPAEDYDYITRIEDFPAAAEIVAVSSP